MFILNIKENKWSQKASLCAHNILSCEGNGIAEVEENNFEVTPTFDDDAHKVIVSEGYGYSWSQMERFQNTSQKAKKHFVLSTAKKHSRRLIWFLFISEINNSQ